MENENPACSKGYEKSKVIFSLCTLSWSQTALHPIPLGKTDFSQFDRRAKDTTG